MLREIQEIIESHTSVASKMNSLSMLHDQFLKDFEAAKDEIVKGYRYCPQCKDYYKANTFELIHLNNKPVFLKSPYLLTDISDAFGDISADYIECPKGHTFKI